MADLGAEMTMEQTDWAHLRELEHLRRLTPQAVIDLDAVVQDARYRAWRVNLETRQLIEQARALHLDRLKNDFPASRSVCLPMSTARQDAIRQGAFAVGDPECAFAFPNPSTAGARSRARSGSSSSAC